jgi:hypothetical protein
MRKMILITLAACAATAAIAADPAPRGPQGAPHGRWARPDFAQMRARHADDVALLLGLRADQRPALDAYLALMMPPHGEGREGRPAMNEEAPAPGAANETELTRLDRLSAHLDKNDARAKQRIDATRKFYTGLTPDQQRRFDALERLHRANMHHGMGHHGMMGHGGPEGGPNRGHGPDRAPPSAN